MRLLTLHLLRQLPRRPTAGSQRAGLDHLLRIAAEQTAARRAAPDAATADDDPWGTGRFLIPLVTLCIRDNHSG